MAHCELCGKHTMFGNKVAQIRSELYSRSKRTFKPNLQRATLMIGGRKQQIRACTRCLRAANRIRQ